MPKRRTEPILPRRGGKNIKGLGKLRYLVEQTFGLLYHHDRTASLHLLAVLILPSGGRYWV